VAADPIGPAAPEPTGTLRFNGADMAAILAAAFGIFALGAVVLATELSKPLQDQVFALGKAWMPNAARIGPYSGKETLLAVAWLGSWLLLHLGLRRRHVDPRPWFAVALLLVLLGLVFVWPPVWHMLGA
jgi:hypothetical protein